MVKKSSHGKASSLSQSPKREEDKRVRNKDPEGQRRLSSSPHRSRKYSFERVLNSQIMQAFDRAEEPPASDGDRSDDVLNMKKIKNLAKLP